MHNSCIDMIDVHRVILYIKKIINGITHSIKVRIVVVVKYGLQKFSMRHVP